MHAWDSDRSVGQGPSVCCSVLITQVHAVRMGHRMFRPGTVTDQRDMVLTCPSESWPRRLTLLKQGHRIVGTSPVTGQRDMVLPCLTLKPGLVSDGRLRVFPCPSTLTTPANNAITVGTEPSRGSWCQSTITGSSCVHLPWPPIANVVNMGTEPSGRS